MVLKLQSFLVRNRCRLAETLAVMLFLPLAAVNVADVRVGFSRIHVDATAAAKLRQPITCRFPVRFGTR